MTDLDISCLRAFLAVVDEGGFTRAAARLNRTQPGVSMQVRRLEDAVGAKLFTRQKGMTLTLAGESLLPDARRLVAAHDEMLARLRGRGVTGHVRIGTPDDYVEALLPLVLRGLSRTHPQVEVDVQCALSVDLIRACNQGRLDLAIITRPPYLDSGVTVRREPLQWVAASEHLAAMRPLPLALFSPGCMFRDVVRRALSDAGLPYRIAYQSVSLASIIAAVSEGLAIAVLARNSTLPRLRVLGPEFGLPPLPDIDIAVYTAKGEVSEAVAAVQQSVVQALRWSDLSRAA
jgi:DNA-binding transcriptional LysR family regulator